MSRQVGARTDLPEAIARYQAAVDDFDRECARVLGVNETDLRCLEILIREVGDATPRYLADGLGLTTGSVTAMLDRLEKLNYVQRKPHPDDRRKVIVAPTPHAVSRVDELIAPLVADGNNLLGGYNQSDLALICEFLTRTADLQDQHTMRIRRQGN
ncbi:MarR family transcriptional regulator [Mycobacterium sp. NPDC050441]|uniref:MarR family winged helix-turn-helix transcriptional regulator n=1 Tax=Mycobacterium sp. NPDC050441 TaxID=3155403 RepID=UPI0033D42074